MTRNRPWNALGVVLAVVLTTGLGASGCRDHIANPTQGFLEVHTGDVVGVEVFVDDVSQGVGTRIGPLEAQTYTVRIEKRGYGATPATAPVTVPAGGTEIVEFALELVDWGQIQVTALDEVLIADPALGPPETEVTGAVILLDTGSGFTATGQVTPATLDRVPLGPASVRVQRTGFQDSAPYDVNVDRVAVGVSEVEAVLGPPRAVLAEMFTYTLCPNCPPSSHELETMQQADPHCVYVVEWHIDSRLPFYDAAWVDRQSVYGNVSGWPAVVFQGGTDPSHVPTVLIGSQASELDAYHTRTADYLAQCGNDCPIAIKVLGSISASAVDTDVHVLFRGGSPPTGLKLYVVVTEDHVVAFPGNQPYFSYVARAIDETTLSFPGRDEVSRVEHSFPVDGSWDTTELHVTAWVQSDVTREVLAVGGF